MEPGPDTSGEMCRGRLRGWGAVSERNYLKGCARPRPAEKRRGVCPRRPETASFSAFSSARAPRRRPRTHKLAEGLSPYSTMLPLPSEAELEAFSALAGAAAGQALEEAEAEEAAEEAAAAAARAERRRAACAGRGAARDGRGGGGGRRRRG